MVSGVGATGLGMEGDYEFTIQSVTPEQVVLKGKKTGNTITMTPMPENETWEAYLTDIEEAEQKQIMYFSLMLLMVRNMT